LGGVAGAFGRALVQKPVRLAGESLQSRVHIVVMVLDQTLCGVTAEWRPCLACSEKGRLCRLLCGASVALLAENQCKSAEVPVALHRKDWPSLESREQVESEGVFLLDSASRHRPTKVEISVSQNGLKALLGFHSEAKAFEGALSVTQRDQALTANHVGR
jgi:hypothetical protein